MTSDQASPGHTYRALQKLHPSKILIFIFLFVEEMLSSLKRCASSQGNKIKDEKSSLQWKKKTGETFKFKGNFSEF